MLASPLCHGLTPDLQDGAFDEAVQGVDAVAHLASPFYTEGVKDPQELIGPAIKGTVEVLESIQKYK
jgi:nucleoside-diphosphate-sugar epimerase